VPPRKPQPEAAAISVGEFTRRVKALLESNLEPCWIRGELSNLRRQASGHVYFTLKDERSQLACVLFRGDAVRQTLELRDGAGVMVYGEVSVYEPRGTHQLICRTILPEGRGRLQERFERLKAKLDAEGLFAPDRKRPIPRWPRTIAVVTSPTGAAIKDFLSVLRRRDWRGRIVAAPSKVQGEGAAGEIVQAMEAVHARAGADLLVVMRGGGSLEDLWCFNEEVVARAIAASPVPVISAVGHEIDFTLSDFAADRRAETPTAAAELISSGRLELIERFSTARDGFERETGQWLRDARQGLDWLRRHLQAHHPKARVEQAHLRRDELQGRMEQAILTRLNERRAGTKFLRQRLVTVSPERRLRQLRESLAALERRGDRALSEALRRKREQANAINGRLEGASLPQALRRGFAVVRDQQGRVVTRKAGLKAGDVLALDFHDGQAAARIEKT